ncbi:hypothetical protein [Microbacterium sp. H1-D42]|uniref:hypothetical protein n=1 Tax=Microbacterium sp. H1-D42 TaxID=2925844 RepID=UPI001F537D64|nr:hypothetical protein [Microbacterium sp. H1-D42]UNK70519.1 hypothetical protein MNR00_15370 [Microbacterium sp. H1-D42]
MREQDVLKDAPDVASLARWMRSWVGDRGQIRGFHNHSVWGTNPFTFLDFTSGHQAFSAPATAAFGEALGRRFDERGLELWRRMMLFQALTVQDDGQYAHIGFQVGESATSGLIHNMAGSIGLLEGLAAAGGHLAEAERAQILDAVRANLDACTVYGGGRPTAEGTCNQEYARVWVKLRYTELSGDDRYDSEIADDLDDLIRLCSVRGIPDADSAGTFRVGADRETGGILEPAEYYGLMVVPLMLASRRYDRPDFAEEARAICRHVARSAWTDERGLTRYHRYWYVDGDTQRISTTPMLIAGMGLTLRGIDEVLADGPDDELADFRARCLRTYAEYQTPAGYFASATGWHNEADVAPSTAWHAHDLMALVHGTELPDDFWDRVFGAHDRRSVLLSDRAYWIEDDVHWAIMSPWTAGDLSIRGRKDRDTFTREFFAWTDKPALPEEFAMPDVPIFFAADDGLYLIGDEQQMDVTTIGPLSYRGPVGAA